MPYHNPESGDPNMLVGVTLPGSAATTRRMAETFADEFAQLGLDLERILALYRDPFYAAPHAAWRLLGEPEIARIVDESLAFWSRHRVVVRTSTKVAEASAPLVQPGGFLKVLS